jgi:outer membrane protein TolC
MRLLRVLIVIAGFSGIAFGQSLTLEEAITTALKNNHDILIAEKNEQLTLTDVHKGNANLLPKLSFAGSSSYNNSVSSLEFNGGSLPPVEGAVAASNSNNAQLQLSYTLFNGFGRINTYKKLQGLGEISKLQTKISLESTVLQVVQAYFDLSRIQEELEIVESNLAVSKDRLTRTQINQQVGSTSRINLLNAQVDFNNDSTNLIKKELDLKRAQNQLNFLLGQQIETPLQVLTVTESPSLDSLSIYQDLASKNRASVLLSMAVLNNSEIDQNVEKSKFFPIVDASLGYGYQNSWNEVGIIQRNSSLGYTAALTLNWNLFDGNKRRSALEKSRIQIEQNDLKKAQALLKVDQEVQDNYYALETQLALLALETKNLEVAELNLSRSKDLLKLGVISNLEFRQAQLNLLRNNQRINQLKYQSTLFQYQLLILTGEMLK